MSFKKMPGENPDLETFVAEYKNMMEETGAEIIPQGTEMINGTKALKFNIIIAKQGNQAPNMQSQIYLLLINNSLYFFESFGPDVITNHAALFKSTAASFQLK